MSTKLIQNLQKADLYKHPTQYFKVIETHISWVILTGEYAYKVKKPVDFEFLNFTTLEQRKYYCELELTLNKKLAPEIYLEVLPITGSADKPEFNGKGPIIDYALVMREFSQENIFNLLLENNKLSTDHIKQVAIATAKFHNTIEKDSPKYFGSPQQMLEAVIQNFEQIRPLLMDENDLKNLNNLETWTRAEHERLLPNLTIRKQQDFIRACHGDMHLGNITLFNNKPVIFDCIEFNESFRWTDVMADVGFLMMDLQQRNQFGLANVFLNQYLLATGDYAGLAILPYYQAYRAMVRAKISLLERTQQLNNKEKSAELLQQYRNFINLVKSYQKPKKPFLIITHGFSASGKSTAAEILVEELGLIQLRSDVERKRLHGLSAAASSDSGLYANIYSEDITNETYDHLLTLAKTCLQGAYPIIIDATFLKQKYRQHFNDLANKCEIPFIILHTHAPMEKLLQWIEDRTQQKGQTSVSEADTKVLLAQQDQLEALTTGEKTYVISVATDKKVNTNEILQLIQEKTM